MSWLVDQFPFRKLACKRAQEPVTENLEKASSWLVDFENPRYMFLTLPLSVGTKTWNFSLVDNSKYFDPNDQGIQNRKPSSYWLVPLGYGRSVTPHIAVHASSWARGESSAFRVAVPSDDQAQKGGGLCHCASRWSIGNNSSSSRSRSLEEVAY